MRIANQSKLKPWPCAKQLACANFQWSSLLPACGEAHDMISHLEGRSCGVFQQHRWLPVLEEHGMNVPSARDHSVCHQMAATSGLQLQAVARLRPSQAHESCTAVTFRQVLNQHTPTLIKFRFIFRWWSATKRHYSTLYLCFEAKL
jgi:hypothetical protein